MRDWTRQQIREILTETWQRQGWQVPDAITDYECAILVEMLARVPWQPQPSYAERYMALKQPQEFLEFGNVCWFTRAVFPQCLQRRGLTEQYFTDLGTAAWQRALDYYDNPTLEQLCQYFDYTAEMTYTAIHCHGDFRSMWD
jgi:hypothetical protein